MRILQIIRSDEPGPVKSLSETVGGGLMERGASVETAVMFTAPGTRAKLRGAWRIAWQILTGNYDAIIAYQAGPSIIAGTAGWLARCRHRIVHQTTVPQDLRTPPRVLDALAGMFGFYTVNIANAHVIAEGFERYPEGCRRALTVIEHGVPLMRSKRTRETTLTRFAIPDDGTIVLATAPLEPERNQLVLIRALSHEPSARLVFIADGPSRDEYLVTAHALGVLNRVHLLGDVTQKDIADLFVAADVFVCPATSETFGLLALEAAVAGLPVIASDLPIMREVLSADGETVAHFVSPLDPVAWARAIAAGPASPARGWVIAQALARRYSMTRMIDAYATLLDLPKQAKVAGRQTTGVTTPEAPAIAKAAPQKARLTRRRVAKAQRRPNKFRQRASNE